MKTINWIALMFFLLGSLGWTTAHAADEVNIASIVKAWEQKAAAISTLHVMTLSYDSSSGTEDEPLPTPKVDAPPIDPSRNKWPFGLTIYRKAGAKECLDYFRFNKDMLDVRSHVGYDGQRGFEMRYGLDTLFQDRAKIFLEQPSEFLASRPSLPFIMGNPLSERIFTALKQGIIRGTGDVTIAVTPRISATTEPGAGTPKFLVTIPVLQPPHEYVMTALLDPEFGFAPIEMQELFDGKPHTIIRMTRYVQVLKDVWLPQQEDATIIHSNGKVMVRMRRIILSLLVNSELPDGLFEPSFPVGTTVDDQINKKRYTVGKGGTTVPVGEK